MFPQDKVISHIGGESNFFCSSSNLGVSITSIEWLLNGTTVESNSMGITVAFSNDIEVGGLILTNITTSFNNTQIQCVAELTSGEFVISNSAPLLLLQGKGLTCCLAFVYCMPCIGPIICSFFY